MSSAPAGGTRRRRGERRHPDFLKSDICNSHSACSSLCDGLQVCSAAWTNDVFGAQSSPPLGGVAEPRHEEVSLVQLCIVAPSRPPSLVDASGVCWEFGRDSSGQRPLAEAVLSSRESGVVPFVQLCVAFRGKKSRVDQFPARAVAIKPAPRDSGALLKCQGFKAGIGKLCGVPWCKAVLNKEGYWEQ